jgi:magnesium-transporting ATPase (P-type)
MVTGDEGLTVTTIARQKGIRADEIDLAVDGAALRALFLLLTSQGWTWGETTAPKAWIGAQATTVVFLAIVILQVGNIFACRTERTSAFTLRLISNPFLLWGIAFELVFAAALIYLPVLQPVFGTAALEPVWWLLLGACAPLVFLADEARKLCVRRRAAAEGGSPA